MKLLSISLIASALAATAGNTIAAPGPLHARSLQQGNFERDIDSVDLFTRNPGDPADWHYPVGPCHGLPSELLVKMCDPQPPLGHPQDHVPPQPFVNPTRNYRQNAPDHRHAEPRRRPSPHSAPLGKLLPAPLPQQPYPLNPQYPPNHVPPQPFVNPTRNYRQNAPDHRHAEPRRRPSPYSAPLRKLLPAPLPQQPYPLNPQHPPNHVPPQLLVNNYRENVHGSSHAPDHGQSGPCPQPSLTDLGHYPQAHGHHPDHGHAEPRHQLPRSAPLRQLLPARFPQQSQHANHPQSAAHPQPQDLQQPQSQDLTYIELAHDQRIAGRSLFRAQAVARRAAIATDNPKKVTYYTKLADDLGRASDQHFIRQHNLWMGQNFKYEGSKVKREERERERRKGR